MIESPDFYRLLDASRLDIWTEAEKEVLKKMIKTSLGFVEPLTAEQTSLKEEGEKLQAELYDN